MKSSRREFLQRTFLTLGIVLGGLATSSCQKPVSVPDGPKKGGKADATSDKSEVRPSLALSLTLLQQEAAKRGRSPSGKLANLGGMNRIQGFMIEPSGEIILLGERDKSLPTIDLDDLVVALRSAYRVGPAYRDAPGCTIDPWEGAKDPWRIQEAKVLGMPPVKMAHRFVTLDYELKKVSAGLLSLGQTVPSLYEMNRSRRPLCGGSANSKMHLEMIHRFWFAPLYSPSPRFVQEEAAVLILKPVGVQLMTEQEFMTRKGQRTGSAPASPQAKRFSERMTKLLAENEIQRYSRLVQDFRVIEVGQLLRFKQVPAESLGYFLRKYPLSEVSIPKYVGGIRREEQGEVVCGAEITERRVRRGTQVRSVEKVQQYQFRSRGGVTARVSLVPKQFTEEKSGVLAKLRRRVREARPSADTIIWPVH